MLVRDMMTRNPITATPETTHKQATELMREHHIHHLPIVDRRGKLVGILVESDLYQAQPSPATTLSIYEIHSLLSSLKLQEIMRSPVITTRPDCPLEEAARLMQTHKIGCLPVLDGEELVGIVTDTDIFKTLVVLLGGGEEGARITLEVEDRPGILARTAQAIADVGGNIISTIAWHQGDKSYITIKERGADFAKLSAALEGLPVRVVNLLERPACNEESSG
jgi:acetoin utilization protein AcuB